MFAMDRNNGWRVIKQDDEEFTVPVSVEAKVKYYLDEAKNAEARKDPYGCKAWLLTGVSIIPDSFALHHEAYMFEKRRKNIPEIAWHFESMYRKFQNQMETEISDMADAVRNLHMTRSKETEEQEFMNKIFNALPSSFQMEVLLSRTEKTAVHYEKCQFMLLLVKLFPDTVSQHGADLLFTLLGYDSDVFSIFRKLLVKELIPAVLQIKQDWNSSKTPEIYEILNQCIEYYVLVTETDETANSSNGEDRWTKLFKLVDHIGKLLRWKITPFFAEYSGPNSIDSLYQKLAVAFNDRKERSGREVGYIAAVLFLQCITSYNEMRYGNRSPCYGGDKSKLVLVEVFIPTPPQQTTAAPNLPTLLTASQCSSVEINQTHLMNYFITATKIWQMINVSKGQEEKDFFTILYSMKSLDIENWSVFQHFSIDYRTYVGQNFSPDSTVVKNPIQLASFHCATNNYKLAAEFAIKAATDLLEDEDSRMSETIKAGEESQVKELDSPGDGHREDVSFFNPHLYATDAQGNFVVQRRVHFLSDNSMEVITYAANILIKCLHDSLEVAATAHNDLCLGHLLTLIQLEWPSPPAEMIFTSILELIRRKGSFRYTPYFGDFVLEPDFLEQFMSVANHEAKTVLLDIWPNATASVTGSSRRMATRGVDKGAKNDFRLSMKRQMMKNGQESLENLILKFLSLYKLDILVCFSQPGGYKKHL